MSATAPSPTPIHLPLGFSFSAVCAGIKASGRDDLALIEAAPGTTAAAVFTKNRVVAAPVEVGRAHLRASRGRVRAVVVNSGNANCATGKPGLQACHEVCRETARVLDISPGQVFPSSTGIIGVPLPTGKILAKLPDLAAGRLPNEHGFRRFAQAIMTTDTRMKHASSVFRVRNREVSLVGVAKGSGMIHPQLATMLVYVLSDISATPKELQSALAASCEQSFNCMSVDGDTSTNDTVLLLASGESGVHLNQSPVRKKFSAALLEVCQSLATQIVQDGEGVKHVIRLHIEQAANREEALRAAKAIAHSLLVKTAWAGADPNWGRILAALGYSGIPVNPAKVNIFIGDQLVCRRGVSMLFDERKAHWMLSQPSCDIRVQLGRGKSLLVFQTADLTAEYVRINADYTT